MHSSPVLFRVFKARGLRRRKDIDFSRLLSAHLDDLAMEIHAEVVNSRA